LVHLQLRQQLTLPNSVMVLEVGGIIKDGVDGGLHYQAQYGSIGISWYSKVTGLIQPK